MASRKSAEFQANRLKWKRAAGLSGVIVVGGVVTMLIEGVWTQIPFPLNLLALVGILIGLTYLITLWWKEVPQV